MPGLDAIDGVTAVAQIVTQSLGILREIYNTVDRLKRDAQCLAMVADEVTRTVRLVSMIESVAALNIEPVLGGVQEVHACAETLYTLVQKLEKINQQGTLVQRFAYQLIKRPVEQVELDDKVRLLSLARDNLLGYVQVAHVGITIRNGANGGAGAGAAINIMVVDQVNNMVHDCPGLESGLRVAILLRELRVRGTIKDDEQEVYVDKDFLSRLEAPVPDSNQPLDPKSDATMTSFIARDLIAKINSVQVAGPIGDGTADRDAFLKYKHVELTGLTAHEGSMQVAGPNSTNTLESLQDHQLRLAAVNKGQQLPNEFFFRKR